MANSNTTTSTRHRSDNARYVMSQIRWLVVQGAILTAAMGLGVRWIWMLLRTIAFGIILLNGFLRMIWYYLRSPYILRRVRYSTTAVPASHVKMRSVLPRRRHSTLVPMTPVDAVVGRSDAGQTNSSDGDHSSTLRRRRGRGPTAASSAVVPPPDSPTDEVILSTPSSTTSEEEQDPSLDESALKRGEVATAVSERGPSPTGGASDTDDDEVAEGDSATGLNNRAFLDVHYPVPVHELIRGAVAADQYDVKARTHAARNVGLRHAKGINVPPSKFNVSSPVQSTPSQQQDKTILRFPVIVCVTGGAWIIGVHFWMAMMARVLSACGFIVVTPDYRNFPAALIPHMVDDVDAAIAWTVNNIQELHGDPTRIYVLGQSAGAHLTMMSMLRQVERLHNPEAAPPVQSCYNPRRDIRAWIGLSGMYDLSGMSDYLHSRGLYKSVLRRMCAGDVSSCSALVQLQKADASALAYHLPMTMLFAHGNCDSSAPFSESAHMAAVLRAKLAEHIASTSSTASREQTPLKAGSWSQHRAGFRESPFDTKHTTTTTTARNASMIDCLGQEMPFVRLHTLAGATHTTPMVEDFLAGRSEIAAILLSLVHSHAQHDGNRADAPSGRGRHMETSVRDRLARTELAAQAANCAASELAALDASFTNAGSVTFSAQTIAAVMEAVVNDGTPQAFLRGSHLNDPTPAAGPLGAYGSAANSEGAAAAGHPHHHALTMAHVKFRPLVFRWQANLASFVSAF